MEGAVWFHISKLIKHHFPEFVPCKALMQSLQNHNTRFVIEV